MTKRGTLSIWTVYAMPNDYPDDFIARRFEIESDGPRPTYDMIQAHDLDIVRAWLQQRGLTCLTRSPDDDANIVECWL